MHTSVLNNRRNRQHSDQTRPIRTKRTAARREPASPVQFAGFAPPALTSLPLLPSHIPIEYVIPAGLIESASVALDMLDAGVLTHTSKELSPAQMIEESMRTWFESITSDLTIFMPHMEMTINLEGLGFDLNREDAYEAFNIEGEDCLSFGVAYPDWQWFTLKDKIEALEAKVTGLGETAIDWLDAHLGPLCLGVTPNFTLHAAQHSQWMGEDDESVLLEEWGSDPETADIFTRAEFDAAFPKLAYEASKKLTAEVLSGLLSHPDREVVDLAAFLLEAVDEDDTVQSIHPRTFSEDHLPTLYPAVCIAWEESDPTVRIVDDYFNYENECGGTDLHGLWAFPKNADGVLSARKSIEQYVTCLKKVEKLLSIIGTKSENM